MDEKNSNKLLQNVITDMYDKTNVCTFTTLHQYFINTSFFLSTIFDKQKKSNGAEKIFIYRTIHRLYFTVQLFLMGLKLFPWSRRNVAVYYTPGQTDTTHSLPHPVGQSVFYLNHSPDLKDF